jgi:glycosyltransferase involved in cell wall biosynthesis
MVGISYLITTHNEGKAYLIPLFKRILMNDVEGEDEIVVLDDYSDDPDTIQVLELTKKNRPDVKIIQHHLDGDFSKHKNFGKEHCTKHFIFQIDGDELPHENLIYALKETILFNHTVDLFRVPRINIVPNITPHHIAKWGWRVNDKGHINFPDYQDRVFRNVPDIHWQNKVHEKIVGHNTHAELPDVEDYCLLHVKELSRQEQQNAFYSTL